jgi:hypothetical protein
VKCYLHAAAAFLLTRVLVRVWKIAGKVPEQVRHFGDGKGFLSLAGILQRFPGSQTSILHTASIELTRLHAHAMCNFKNLF